MEYKLLFKVIPELPTDSTIFLPEHINFDSPDKLTIHLSQEDGETNENLKARADREIQRELLRISVLEDIFFNMEYTSSSPQLRYGFVGQASTMCIFRPVRRTGAGMHGSLDASDRLHVVLPAVRKILLKDILNQSV